MYRLKVLQLEGDIFDDGFNYAYELYKDGKLIANDLFFGCGAGHGHSNLSG